MTSGNVPPTRCPLCNAPSVIVPAGFQQVYLQMAAKPALLDWWECRACNGLFVHPVPAPDVIEKNWGTVFYQDPKLEIEVSNAKEALQRRVLKELSRRTTQGPLLDFGCNFGQFLLNARGNGWVPSGFEANVAAAEKARAKGFEVRCGWDLQDAGFPRESFAAITAIDVFGLVCNPLTTLYTFHDLLKPGGVLAMRLTNKRFILEVIRAFSKAGPTKDARVSRILQGQFHSIGATSLIRILRNVGFDHIRIQPHAPTVPWRAMPRSMWTAYFGADLAYFLSLTRVNVSPGISLFAQKKKVNR
jgi:SAM-dependent methyltransferase